MIARNKYKVGVKVLGFPILAGYQSTFCKLILLLLLCFGLEYKGLYAQQPAQLTCLEVVADDVIARWEAPSDLTGFQHYLLHYSFDGNSFSDVSGPITNLSYQHNNIQAATGIRFLFVEAVFNTGSAYSDTLQTIWLRLNNFVPDYNPVLLVWNAVADPLPSGADPSYEVYQEFPPSSNNWVLKASTTDLRYTETVLVCDDSVNYKVVQNNSFGCSSVSNINGARFATIVEPPPPLIDSISVTFDGHAVFGWEPSALALGYFVFRWEGNSWIKIDTTQQSYYVDTTVNACLYQYSYTVEMRDTCLNDGPKDETEARTNMLLDTLIYNSCDKAIRAEWTAYQYPDPSAYEIWCSIDGADFVKVGEVDGNTTGFDHDNPQVQSQYSYYIRAIFATGTSTTCVKSVFTPDYVRPADIYFANADVEPTNNIHLKMFLDTIPNACSWELWRSELNGGNPSVLEYIPKTSSTLSVETYTDSTANPSAGFYDYYLIALDSCGDEVFTSNMLTTIWLTGEKQTDNVNVLNWNAFEGWNVDVEEYDIYRMIGTQEPQQPIASVASTVFSYTDNVDALGQQNGQLTYWVEAKENANNSYGFLEKSKSNRLPLFIESKLYMPTAFKPGGYTPTYKPVFTYFGGRTYLFQIYNRWGQLIFETDDSDEAWDGTHKNQPVPQGAYVYRLVYTGQDEITHEQKGFFNVIY